MRRLGCSAIGALFLVGCGPSDLGRGNPVDYGGRRTQAIPHESIASDAAAPDATRFDSAPTARDASDPSFCVGAGWSDPRSFVILGSTQQDILFVRADGTRKTVAAVKGDGSLSWARAGGYYAIQETLGVGHVRLLRLDASGGVLLDTEVSDLPLGYGTLGIEADGTMTLKGIRDAEVRILPDGSVERRDATPESTTRVPPTPEGYLVLGDADVAGWKVVALPSGIVPLDDAFYETSTGHLQRVRYRSDWAPNLVSKGRLVYLGTTPQGIALVDEGVAEARTALLPGTLKGAQVYGNDDRAVVRQNDVPIAWLDGATRAVTVFSEVIALVESGAAHVGYRVQVLVKDGVARRIIDTESLRDIDVGTLNLPSAADFAVQETTDTALVTADGVPILWLDRRTPSVVALDRNAVLGAVPAGKSAETPFTQAGALAVYDGLPRSWIDLTTGKVSKSNLAVPAGAVTKTHVVEDRAVVTVDGVPSFVLDIGTGLASDIAAVAGPISYDSVLTTSPWLVGMSGLAPVFRVNVDTLKAEGYAAASLPLPDNFYDKKFTDGLPNPPAYGGDSWAGQFRLPSVSADGTVLSALRDDKLSGAYVLAPSDPAWRALGQTFHDVVWTSIVERTHSWIVQSGHEYSCYCTWPHVSWAEPDAGTTSLLGDAVQIVPRNGAPPVAVRGEAALDFHPSDTCVVVTPSSSGGAPVDSPFAYDIERGIVTSFGGMRSIRWVDRQ